MQIKTIAGPGSMKGKTKMPEKTRFVAEWLDNVCEPPAGEEFDADRDCVYKTATYSRFEDAQERAHRLDMNGEGRVHVEVLDESDPPPSVIALCSQPGPERRT